jgi:L-threonylcarbamoyladenylate synthase
MCKIFRVSPRNPEVNVITAAVDVIKDGGLIEYPTDTVYGLGVNALNSEAVIRVFNVKQRPLNKPLPLAVSGLGMASKLAIINDKARKLVKVFWPGALTIILKKKLVVPSIVVSGGTSVGLRMPNHAVPLMITKMCGFPLIATSANKHGKPNILGVQGAIRQIGNEVDLVLDCGKTRGQPSTIIDLTKMPPQIVRTGSVTKKMLEKEIGSIAC